MAETKNVAIWTALIGASATVIVGLFTLLGAKGSGAPPPAGGTDPTAIEDTAHPAVGTVRVPPQAQFAWVYEAPVFDPGVGHVGQISDGQQVAIICTVQGPPQTTPYATSTLWNKIKLGTGYGYINDSTVDTGTRAAVAPPC